MNESISSFLAPSLPPAAPSGAVSDKTVLADENTVDFDALILTLSEDEALVELDGDSLFVVEDVLDAALVAPSTPVVGALRAELDLPASTLTVPAENVDQELVAQTSDLTPLPEVRQEAPEEADFASEDLGPVDDDLVDVDIANFAVQVAPIEPVAVEVTVVARPVMITEASELDVAAVDRDIAAVGFDPEVADTADTTDVVEVAKANRPAFSSDANNAVVADAPVPEAGADPITPTEPLQFNKRIASLPSTDTPVVDKPTPAATSVPREELSPLTRNVMERLETLELENGVTKISLRPRGLGLMEFDLSQLPDGRMRVTIRVENPMILDALRAESGALGQFMGEKGFNLSQGEPDLEQYHAPPGSADGDDSVETDMPAAAVPTLNLRTGQIDIVT